MLARTLCLGFLFLAGTTLTLAQHPSSLVGTWAGSVEGFDIGMKFVLNADGTADLDGIPGAWRVQGNKLWIFEEGEASVYNFRLQGSQLILTGEDLLAPLVLSRVGGPAPTPDAGGGPGFGQPAQGMETPRAGPAPQPAAPMRGLSEADVIELLEGGVSSRRLIDLVQERGIAFRLTPALASELKAKGATEELLSALGQGGQAPGEPVAAKPLARGTARAVPGNRYNHEKWGISFVNPPNWKAGERAGALLLGSDTEAGLMVVRFLRRTNLQSLAEGYQEGLEEEGMQLMPATQLQNFSVGRSQGLAGELAGIAQDGARIRARIIAIPTPFGDAALVLGLTTEEKYAGLKPRVDALAASLTFAPPQVPPVLEFLAGQYFYISTSSFGSSERYINLCSDGRFSERRDIYSTGDAGTAYGEAGESAQWSAEGDESQGMVTVTYPNGETTQFQYRRSGGALYVGGRKYARYGDGSCTKTSVY